MMAEMKIPRVMIAAPGSGSDDHLRAFGAFTM